MGIPVAIAAMEGPAAIKMLIVIERSARAGWCGVMAAAAARISAAGMGRGIGGMSGRETDARNQDNQDFTQHRTSLLVCRSRQIPLTLSMLQRLLRMVRDCNYRNINKYQQSSA